MRNECRPGSVIVQPVWDWKVVNVRNHRAAATASPISSRYTTRWNWRLKTAGICDGWDWTVWYNTAKPDLAGTGCTGGPFDRRFRALTIGENVNEPNGQLCEA